MVAVFEDGRGRDVSHCLASTRPEAAKLVSQSVPSPYMDVWVSRDWSVSAACATMAGNNSSKFGASG